MVALLVGSGALAGFHWVQRGEDVTWKFYDPTLVYALPGSSEELMEDSCGDDLVFGFGSSVMLAAFLELPPRPEGRWTLTPASTGTGPELRIVTRYGSTDLRLFQPLARALPKCPKTILLHSDTLVARDLKKPRWSDFYYTAVYRLSSWTEALWPAWLRRKTGRETIRPVGVCDAACLESRRRAMRRRYRSFDGLEADHVEILQALVDGGARVVVLDVGRSELLESEFAESLASFRSAVQALSDRIEGVDYFGFPSQPDDLYADYTHLGPAGKTVFARWLASTSVLAGPQP